MVVAENLGLFLDLSGPIGNRLSQYVKAKLEILQMAGGAHSHLPCTGRKVCVMPLYSFISELHVFFVDRRIVSRVEFQS